MISSELRGGLRRWVIVTQCIRDRHEEVRLRLSTRRRATLIRVAGTRGGQDQFKWEDVKSDKYRENYLGHSVKAPLGRWQKGIVVGQRLWYMCLLLIVD